MNHAIKHRFFLSIVALALLLGGADGFARCGCFSFQGDFLYLKPCENGLAYGIVGQGFASLQLPTLGLDAGYETTVKSPNFRYEPGFRLALSYQNRCAPWEFLIEWLHFCGTGHGLVDLSRPKTDEYFVGTWSRPTLTVILPFFIGFPDVIKVEQTARAKLDLSLHIVDIGFAFPLCPSSCFRVKPELAVRIGCIDQTYKLFNTFDGTRIFTGQDPYFASYEEKIRFGNDFFGAGLLVGLETEYLLGCRTSFFGQFKGSLLRGHFDLRGKYFADMQADDSEDPFALKYALSQNSRVCLLQPILDLAFGVRYKSALCNGCYPLTLQLSWEQHSYFGQNQLQSLGYALNEGEFGVSQSNCGDLALQGWSFAANIEF